jgi:hypothetical protein
MFAKIFLFDKHGWAEGVVRNTHPGLNVLHTETV